MSNKPPKDPPSPSHSRARRASITDLFARPGNINTNANNPQAQPHGQRRMSLTTIGLGIPGTSPTQPSPFGSMRRRDSVSSSAMSTSPTNNNGNSNASTENAILEDDEGETPVTPSASTFARRVSFGGVGASARARSGSGISPSSTSTANASSSSSSSSANTSTGMGAARGSGAATVPRTSPFQFKRSPSLSHKTQSQTPTDSPAAEGFNWPEALRTRAERAPSFTHSSMSTSPGSGGMQMPGMRHHARSASVASVESPAKTDPIVDMPVQTPRVQEQPQKKKKVNKPDYFQEKILRADFMD